MFFNFSFVLNDYQTTKEVFGIVNSPNFEFSRFTLMKSLQRIAKLSPKSEKHFEEKNSEEESSLLTEFLQNASKHLENTNFNGNQLANCLKSLILLNRNDSEFLSAISNSVVRELTKTSQLPSVLSYFAFRLSKLDYLKDDVFKLIGAQCEQQGFANFRPADLSMLILVFSQHRERLGTEFLHLFHAEVIKKLPLFKVSYRGIFSHS